MKAHAGLIVSVTKELWPLGDEPPLKIKAATGLILDRLAQTPSAKASQWFLAVITLLVQRGRPLSSYIDAWLGGHFINLATLHTRVG